MDSQNQPEEQAERAITPLVEKTVEFYGDSIQAAEVDGGDIYVPLRPLATFLGVDPRAQQQRAARDPVMREAMSEVLLSGADGRQRALLCLRLDMLPGWLFGITTGKMSADLQEKLNRYRRECFRVLWNAFKGDIVANRPTRPGSLTRAEETFALVDAMREMALQQIEFEHELTRLDSEQQVSEQKREVMANWMRGFVQDTRSRMSEFEVRISSLEMKVDPRNSVTEAEAAEIALAVKNVAYALEQRSGVSSYGRVYGELYRRFDVRSYRVIPRDKYDAVIRWLRGWYDEVMAEKDKDSES